MLVAIRAADLTVARTSANSEAFVGLPPSEVLGRPVLELFEPDTRPGLAQFLAGAETHFSNPFPIRLPSRDGAGTPGTCDAIASRLGDAILLELELQEGLAEPAGQFGGDAYLRLVQQTLNDFHSTPSLDAFCKVGADAVFGFTGFERVMVYRFERDGHGCVVAEATEPGQEKFLGLHFPASDIPEQARRLYRLNWLRLIADADYTPVPIVGGDSPLDLTHSVLRSVSPVHLEYMRNMGVAASMSISLVNGDALWGLILCHHGTPRRVSYATRTCAVTLATLFSAQLLIKERALADTQRRALQAGYRKLVAGVAAGRSVEAALKMRAEKLLELFSADGLALCMGEEIEVSGSTPPEPGVCRMRQRLNDLPFEPVIATDAVAERLPGLDGYREAAGLLAIRLGSGDHLLFFRKDLAGSIRWAGNPDKTVQREPDGRLGPRNSFAAFIETARGRSRPWSDEEMATAAALQGVLVGFVAHRIRDHSALNRQIAAKTDEMESFVYSVSHDLKSPLVTCRGFIGLLLEDLAVGDLDAVRDSAARIDRATVTMGRLIDALLDLSRIGNPAVHRPVDVAEIVRELVRLFDQRASEAGARIVVGDLPPALASAVEINRVFDNLITNALKYGCPAPGHTIRVSGQLLEGADMVRYEVADDGPGIPAQYHRRVFQLFQRLDSGKEGTGVGLATVAKVARIHGGDAWVESIPGEGARFFFTLPAPERLTPVNREKS